MNSLNVITYRELKEIDRLEQVDYDQLPEREREALKEVGQELYNKLYNPPTGYKLVMFWSDKKGGYVNFHVKVKETKPFAKKRLFKA